MADVAVFCNNYPNIEVEFEVRDSDDITASDPVQISVKLEREVDDDDEEEEDDEAYMSEDLYGEEEERFKCGRRTRRGHCPGQPVQAAVQRARVG